VEKKIPGAIVRGDSSTVRRSAKEVFRVREVLRIEGCVTSKRGGNEF